MAVILHPMFRIQGVKSKKIFKQIVFLFYGQWLSAFNSIANGRLEKSSGEPEPMPQPKSFNSLLYAS
ncbi:MAG: hypothetical protein QG552_1876 [Thermodesulfobacteriota bacterium]|nr:hypothetical protein [Thermodesulfobacteriota bacterium]